MIFRDNFRLYYILAIIFGILAIGIFLFPGVPQTGLGWMIKALVLLAFGVYTWLILQEFQIQAIADKQKQQTYDSHTPITERTSDISRMKEGQLGLEFDPTDGDENELLDDAVQAYEEFQHQLIQVIQNTMVSHTVAVYVANPDDSTLVLQDGVTSTALNLQKSIKFNAGLPGKVFIGNTGVIESDIKDDAGSQISYYDIPTLEVRSYLGVPLKYKQHAIGVLMIDDTAQESYGQNDLDLLERYAGIVAKAMTQYDVLDRIVEQRDFYSRLFQVNAQLTLTDSKEDLLAQIIRVCKTLFDYETLAVILLQSQESNQAEIAALDGASTHFNTGFRFEIEESGIYKVIQSGEPQLYNNLDPGQTMELLPEFDTKEVGAGSILIVPIKSHSDVYGTIILESSQPSKFSKHDLNILMTVGSVFGAGLNRFFLFRYMKNIATRDGLTGVHNYRAFRERLEEEIERSRRYQTKFTLIISDLDKFKNVNDSHGHLYGDYMLKKVADIIKESVRSVDMVARYGGEEFGVILVNASANNSYKTAERIRTGVKNFHFEKNDIKERITISLGMAEFPTHGEDADTLIRNADEAMYRVKQLGGNAVKQHQNTEEIKEA